MFDVGDFSSSSAATLSGSSSLISSFSSKKRKMKNNQRRFSDEQIKSLETMFESETNLEPRKKLQLARELGLQPRQVAIWFQNKRARWKSKQLERDYSLLRSNYNNLASQYESLNKEKQSLVMQLQKLNDLMKKSQNEGQCYRREIGFDRSSENRDNSNKKDMEVRPSLSFELSEHGIGVISDDDSSINIKTDYLGLEEDNHDLLNMVEPAADSSLTSPENWGSLDNDCELLDQPSTGYQWWDFWS